MNQNKATILALDDQPDNLLVLEAYLGDDFLLRTFFRGQDLLDYLVGGGSADLILLDILMPPPDGFSICRWIKENPTTRDIAVIFLTSLDSAQDEARALSLGAEDFIHKPLSPPVVLARVRNHLALRQARRQLQIQNQDLERLVAERTRQIQQQSDELLRRTEQLNTAQASTIAAFCSLAETRDNETGNHIHRTQHYLRALCERLKFHPRFSAELSPENIALMFKSAPLHDIGKVGIPDHILLKQGKLDPDEWVIMQRHAEFGRDAIAAAELEQHESGSSFLRCAKEIAYSHHERWDGKGYPQGLVGDAIPLSARLMAVADVYDALISRRVYKPPMSHDAALALMAQESGKHFDPDILAAMLDIADHFKAIAERFSDPEG